MAPVAFGDEGGGGSRECGGGHDEGGGRESQGGSDEGDGVAHSSLGALQPFSTLMVMDESPHQTGHSPVGGSKAVPCAPCACALAQHLP